MRVFISYRRTSQGRPSTLVLNLAAALENLGVEVVLDRKHVLNQSMFASELVDRGLNRCEALIALIDANWLAPRNLARLRASAAMERGTDWVDFELRYGLSYELAFALVGEQAHLTQAGALTLPGLLSKLVDCERFETDGSTIDKTAAHDLVRGLKAMCDESPRKEAIIIAGQEHNSPTELNLVDALTYGVGTGWKAAVLRLAEMLLRNAFVVTATVVAFGIVGSVFRGKFTDALVGAGVVAALILIASLIRRAWVKALQLLVNWQVRKRRING